MIVSEGGEQWQAVGTGARGGSDVRNELVYC